MHSCCKSNYLEIPSNVSFYIINSKIKKKHDFDFIFLFKECVRILRQLQTNEEVIEKQQQTKIRDQLRMENMHKLSSRAGVTVSYLKPF